MGAAHQNRFDWLADSGAASSHVWHGYANVIVERK
jgi:hypothetical protein